MTVHDHQHSAVPATAGPSPSSVKNAALPRSFKHAKAAIPAVPAVRQAKQPEAKMSDPVAVGRFEPEPEAETTIPTRAGNATAVVLGAPVDMAAASQIIA